MNEKLIKLAEERAALVAKAANQRAGFLQGLECWRGPLNVADQGWSAVQYLGKNPVLLGGAVAFLVALRPWRMMKWLPPGWFLWRIARLAFGARGILRGC